MGSTPVNPATGSGICLFWGSFRGCGFGLKWKSRPSVEKFGLGR
jgi:hypothetical protein